MRLIPAYGRDYKTEVEVEVAFYGGKDFYTCGLGRPQLVNIEDLRDQGYNEVNVRYNKLRKVVPLKVK